MALAASALTLATAGVWIDAALAQPALEEIVVTARRREENLMQVPIAVSAVTSAVIEDKGLRSIIELAEFTPGLFSQVGGNGRTDRASRRLTFRGLSVANGAVFIDGAPYTGSGAPDITDVERVEILKGPQSVFFGRATYSGAVNYVTKAPTDEFSGKIAIDAYKFGSFDGSVSLSGPIVADKLGFRVRARGYSFDGHYKSGVNPALKMGQQDTRSISGTVDATPTDNLSIQAFYSHTYDDDGVPTAASIKVAGGAPILNCNLGGTGGTWWCGELPKVTAFTPANISVYATMDPFTRRELIGNVRGYPVPFRTDWSDHFGIRRKVDNASLRIDYDLDGGWSVNVIAAYNRTKQQNIVDQQYRDASNIANPFYPATPAALAAACNAAPGTPANQPCFTQPFHQLALIQQSIVTDWSGEFRVSSPQDNRLRGTFGASHVRTDNPGGSNFGFQPSGRLTQPSTKTGARTPAVFGGLYYDVTDAFTVSAEARYQWDAIRQQQLFPAFGPKFAGTFKSFSPRVSLDYQMDDDSMVYATFARGFRPGGFNSTLVGLAQSILDQIATLGSNLTFKQEKLDNWELGHKANWMDNRLRTTVAAYYMPWRNGQVVNTQFFTRPDGSTGSATVTQNIGRVNLKGIELEASFAATDAFTIDGTVDLNRNTVKSYVCTPDCVRIRNSTNIDGNRLDQSPSIQFTVSPSYRDNLTGDWDWHARVDYRYRGKVYFDLTNSGWLSPRSLVNARTGISRESLRIDFYVNNLFNDKHLTEAVRGGDTLYSVNPTVPCPPCFTAAAPPGLRGGSILNELRVGLPVKRTFGVAASYAF
jgi:iron complex outermembrane receptor protein